MAALGVTDDTIRAQFFNILIVKIFNLGVLVIGDKALLMLSWYSVHGALVDLAGFTAFAFRFEMVSGPKTYHPKLKYGCSSSEDWFNLI